VLNGILVDKNRRINFRLAPIFRAIPRLMPYAETQCLPTGIGLGYKPDISGASRGNDRRHDGMGAAVGVSDVT
jgi:hypothetical protein